MNSSNKNNQILSPRKIHKLKIQSEFFEKIRRGVKTAELRKADRNFELHDTLILQEYIDNSYTGRVVKVEIIDISDVGQFAYNYLLLSIKLIL